METIVRRVSTDDCLELASIMMHAYPGLEGITEDSISKLAQNLRDELSKESTEMIYGAYRGSKLLGAIRLHQFTMTLRAVPVRIGGIAGVCVHLLHKKEKVSRDLLSFALKTFHSWGIQLVSLYPFQTGFYKKMGFGYGAMKHQYRLKPDAFPKEATKINVTYLSIEDRADMLACYRYFSQSRTGMLERQEADFNEMFQHGNSVVGVRHNGEITGYLSFGFRRPNPQYYQKYDLFVEQFVYRTPDALAELCSFLNSQSDQVQQIVLNTQDEDFHYLFLDPMNGRFDSFETAALETTVTAVGAMYRVLDVKKLLAELQACQFGPETCRLKIIVHDNFFESEHGETVIHFKNGMIMDLQDDGEYDVAMTIRISEFSSLIVGAVGFRSLFDYGLVKLSNLSYMSLIHRLFAVQHKPRNDLNF